MSEDQFGNSKNGGSSSNNLTKKNKPTELEPKKRNNELHKLLYKPNGLPDGAELAYIVKGKKLCTGYKMGSLIVCTCCSKKMTPSQFENHAGMGGRRQPYRYIRTSDKRTLHDIALSLAKDENIVIGCNASKCTICHYGGGEPIHCTVCNRSFHTGYSTLQSCLATLWQCPDCRSSSSNSNRNSSVGESANAVRPTQLVESKNISCVICRAHDFSTGPFNDRTVIFCDQCNKEFHVGCLREKNLCDLKKIPPGEWFCHGCSIKIVTLENLVPKVEEQVANLSPIIQKHAKNGLTFEPASYSVRWRIMRGKDWISNEQPLLSRAVEIFKERFGSINDENGNDLINPMVFGKIVRGQDFSRIYTALLTVNSYVVSVALFKFIDQELVELPLVATSGEQEGKGHFKVLFSCIWGLLRSLKVKKLVLPAAAEALSLWTKRYGFRKMRKEGSKSRTRDIRLIVFRGTSMLEKEID